MTTERIDWINIEETGASYADIPPRFLTRGGLTELCFPNGKPPDQEVAICHPPDGSNHPTIRLVRFNSNESKVVMIETKTGKKTEEVVRQIEPSDITVASNGNLFVLRRRNLQK